MAKIADGTLRNWNNGETMDEAAYEQDREILRVAINDNADQHDQLRSSQGASAIGVVPVTGITGTSVQAILEGLKTLDDINKQYLLDQIGGVVLGSVPDGSITTVKLSEEAMTYIDNAGTKVASGISITDAGTYYASTTVEDTLQEIGSTLNGIKGSLSASVTKLLNS